MKYVKMSMALFFSSFFTLYSASGYDKKNEGINDELQFNQVVFDTIQGYRDRLQTPVNIAGNQGYRELLERTNKELADSLAEENLLITMLRYKEGKMLAQELSDYLTLVSILEATIKLKPRNMKTALKQQAKKITEAKDTLLKHISTRNSQYVSKHVDYFGEHPSIQDKVKALESRIDDLRAGNEELHPRDVKSLAEDVGREYLLPELEVELAEILAAVERDWYYDDYYEAWTKNNK